MEHTASIPPSTGGSGKASITAVCRIIATGFILAYLSGCATTKSHSSVSNLEPAQDELKIVLMPVDVQLSILTAGGTLEPQAEWTRDAEEHMLAALKQIDYERDGDFIFYNHPENLEPAEEKILEVERLHRAVGQAILFHKYQVPLPTKKEAFDWSLGPEVKALQEKTGADYALFIHVEDSYSSAGRVFVQFAAALLGVGVSGGRQVGFTSLVDLYSGNVVWFNYIFDPTGDLRTPEPAMKTVELLLKDLPE